MEKKMKYFNDKPAFERYFKSWQSKQLGIEEPVPNCVKRLMVDSKQRQEQLRRDQESKIYRDRDEEEQLIMKSKMQQKRIRKDPGTRKFSKFIDDQMKFQNRCQEKIALVLKMME